jgi:hypothetical protein
MIGFRYRQCDGSEAGLGEMVHAVLEEEAAETVATTVGCDAQLGDVRDVVGDPRAQHHADQSAVGFVP